VLARSWGASVIVWDEAGPRTVAESRFLQTAAHLSGVPATTVFLAGARREEPTNPQEFVVRARRILQDLGMTTLTHHDSRTHENRAHEPNEHAERMLGATVLTRRDVVAASRAGTWFPLVKPFDSTYPDGVIGTLTSASGAVDSVRASTFGLVLHQRFAGTVPAGTALIIVGVMPDPRTPRSP
jgi:predicted deacylase